ncbi:MAG: ATP-binding protein, partial [Mycobacterium sp.]|uniref:ATP-binding protein n=1 Tax=Mycobacterium sp. TaxID=1785 RepID=UPI003F9A067B
MKIPSTDSATVPSAPVRPRADSRRLQQVFRNLLSNALKFTPEHGEVRVTLERDGDRARVTIADSGEGIGSDFLPRIFDRF